MDRYAAWLIGAALLAAGCGSAEPVVRAPAPGPAPATDGLLVGGYHPYWTGSAWQAYDLETLDVLYFFQLEAAGDGTFADRHGWPDRWFRMRQHVQERGVRVVPTITLFDAASFEALFAGPGAAARTLVDGIAGLVRDSPGLGGIQLDVEIFAPVSAEARDGFTRFVADVRRALDAAGEDLSLSVYGLAYDSHDAMDEAALAPFVDYFVVQGYDFHSRGGDSAGPVAALEGWGQRNWRYVVDRYVGLGVPRAKIVMAVPFFGYEWPTETDRPGARTRGAGETITYAPVDTVYLRRGTRKSALEQVARHGLRRDPASGSPYYAYQDSTGWRQGWFEDAESLRAKFAFVREQGLRGVAVFPLSYGDETLQAVLRESFRSTNP